MNWKRVLVAAPLSATLIFSAGAGAVSAESMEHEPTVETAAVDLRVDLGHLLSEHAFLAIETMRNGADGSEDFDASVAALNSNTEDLTAAISSVYGEEAGQSFNEMWSNHIGYFVDYVNATAEGDEEAKQMALDELSQYKEDFAQFLETATGERLEAGSLAESLQMHVDQLIGAFDSYVAGDYETAYQHEREAINHMHMVAKGLSSAIVDQMPEQFNNTMAVTPAGDLRANLGHLLSEHAGLAVIAMQNGIDGAEHFDASTMVLSENTGDLSAAIGSVYGEEAAQSFENMWSEHIGYFVDYVNATAEENEEAKQEALDNLSTYKEDFSAFIETATGGNVPAEDLANGLQMHVEQLIGAFDNYAQGNYEEAYNQAREAYGHMYDAATLLSSGIVMQNPDMFASDMPSGMPQTGLGTPADDNNMAWAWILGASVFGLAGFAAIRKFKPAENQK
ncbi:copper amine oxidase [Lentibacillus sediminis]|uniref:copper amine oxidase n=1 Tax=Lentibacillus sediminis TaxID=1940529 RepID=UPI000C1C7E8D|nr:copper amine oxidase [Lentibacillus sediminis]